VLARADRVIK